MNIDEIIAKLTLEEKCSLLVGEDNWHITPIERLLLPRIMMADGPHGLRKEASEKGIDRKTLPAVCYPPAVTIASSFDPEVARKMGEAIGRECRAQKVDMLLGPGVNIKRNPLCGRNFEYYSEDPLLAAEMAKGFVSGLQSQNVGACLKHYALNSQETYRLVSSSIADERAKHELYFKAFRDTLVADPDMVMCSYNRVDDIYASENRKLLDETLRKHFGFEKVIVSDWGAVKDRAKALKATLDLEMPGTRHSVDELIEAFGKGLVTMAEIDQSVARILKLVASKKENQPLEVSLAANHDLAKEIAGESLVLLKNENQILPLAETQSVALIGALAKQPRFQGGGSSHINPFKVDLLTDFMPEAVVWEYAPGYRLEGDGYQAALVETAKNLARTKDTVVLVIGLTDEYESEGYDRVHLEIPKGHQLLLEAIAEVNPRIVVILQIGSPIVMPWLDKCRAVLNSYLGGEAGARAVIDALYGKLNPSGRLAETFALSLSDIPSTKTFAQGNNQVYYLESIYVGYRYFETAGLPVLFPFGYGLSYTDFTYSDLVLSTDTLRLPEILRVAVKVKNSGQIPGKEVIQLYVANPTDGVYRPDRELRAFKKVFLNPGEETVVEFELDKNAFSYYDEGQTDFLVPSGQYRIEIRKNAASGLLESVLEVVSQNEYAPAEKYLRVHSYYKQNKLTFSDQDFHLLTGVMPNQPHLVRKRPYNMDDSLDDISHTLIGRIFRFIVFRIMKKTMKEKSEFNLAQLKRTVNETTLRSIVVFSNGMISFPTMEGIIELTNNHFRKAIRRFRGKQA